MSYDVGPLAKETLPACLCLLQVEPPNKRRSSVGESLKRFHNEKRHSEMRRMQTVEVNINGF